MKPPGSISFSFRYDRSTTDSALKTMGLSLSKRVSMKGDVHRCRYKSRTCIAIHSRSVYYTSVLSLTVEHASRALDAIYFGLSAKRNIAWSGVEIVRIFASGRFRLGSFRTRPGSKPERSALPHLWVLPSSFSRESSIGSVTRTAPVRPDGTMTVRRRCLALSFQNCVTGYMGKLFRFRPCELPLASTYAR